MIYIVIVTVIKFGISNICNSDCIGKQSYYLPSSTVTTSVKYLTCLYSVSYIVNWSDGAITFWWGWYLLNLLITNTLNMNISCIYGLGVVQKMFLWIVNCSPVSVISDQSFKMTFLSKTIISDDFSGFFSPLPFSQYFSKRKYCYRIQHWIVRFPRKCPSPLPEKDLCLLH